MKICNNCNTQNADNALFCTGCGANLNNPNMSAANHGMQPKPKKKKKKWWIILIVIVLIFFIFWSIGKAGDSENSNPNSSISQNEQNNVGDYKVEIKESRIVNDGDNDILIVTYSFTNNSNKDISFGTAINDKAYQNGIELGTVWSSYGIDDLDFELKSKDIKPGVTFDVQCAYELNDNSTDVNIELTHTIWSDKVEQTFTITIA